VHTFADGTVGYATGTVSADAITGLGAGAPIRGLVGDVLLPVAAVAQQIALNVALPGVGRLALAAADIAQQVEQSARTNMALNLSGILGAAGQAISGINTSGLGNISQILGAGLNIASSAFAPAPSATPYPTYGPAPQPMMQTMAPAIRAGTALAPMMVGTGSLIRQLTVPILNKMAATLGKRYSLPGALTLIKKLGKIFSSPEAIALYVGISVSEMAQLITAQASRKRRTMNPANTKALRRSLRRLKSFDKLAARVSGQLSRGGRRRPARGRSRCNTCRQSPCSC
jgi:hypothetical protein